MSSGYRIFRRSRPFVVNKRLTGILMRAPNAEFFDHFSGERARSQTRRGWMCGANSRLMLLHRNDAKQRESAPGQKRTSAGLAPMSVLLPKADICGNGRQCRSCAKCAVPWQKTTMQRTVLQRKSQGLVGVVSMNGKVPLATPIAAGIVPE